jgi:hypothetical protein
MRLLDKLEWALHTVREKLTFGMGEAEGIKHRESRVKGVLIDAVKEVKEIEGEMRAAGFVMCKYGENDPRLCLKDFPLIEEVCKEAEWYQKAAR